jgi:hypothetical protein
MGSISLHSETLKYPNDLADFLNVGKYFIPLSKKHSRLLYKLVDTHLGSIIKIKTS